MEMQRLCQMARQGDPQAAAAVAATGASVAAAPAAVSPVHQAVHPPVLTAAPYHPPASAYSAAPSASYAAAAGSTSYMPALAGGQGQPHQGISLVAYPITTGIQMVVRRSRRRSTCSSLEGSAWREPLPPPPFLHRAKCRAGR